MQTMRGLINQEYAQLSPYLKNMYDMLSPQAKQEVAQLRNALQRPLSVALQQYLSETGARNKWRSYKQHVGPERDPGTVIPYGNDTPGWKRFGQ